MDENVKIHLSAMISAIQYIDDLIRISNSDTISQQLIQTQEGPKLNKMSESQIKEALEKLTPKLDVKTQVLQVIENILQNSEFKTYFLPVIDETKHKAYNYYQIIQKPVSIVVILLRLSVTDSFDNFVIENQDSTNKLLTQKLLQADQKVGQDLSLSGSSASLMKKLNKIYQPQQIYQYSNLDQIIDDLIQIGVNCYIFNNQSQYFVELSFKYLQNLSKLCERYELLKQYQSKIQKSLQDLQNNQ